ncbi:MAG: N-acyl-D-amino-acid deacylase family protein [Promethearchaeota archaeon]|jgi:N-acyl-D-amino-acid deacylase
MKKSKSNVKPILIKNGNIIDGTGNPWFNADIEITEGMITKISTNLRTELDDLIVIDAEGMVISPGFIDVHSHADMSLIFDQKLECLAQQGITTIVVGNCGLSQAPLNPEKEGYFRKSFEVKREIPWHTFKEYLEVLENLGSSLNVVPLVGFGIIRRSVLEDANRSPTDEELKQMQSYVEEAMQAGAYGISTGLIYPPQTSATTQEITECAKVAGKYGGLYFSHMRNEGDYVLEAIKELIKIVENSGCRSGQISHIKVAGPLNWGKSVKMLQLIEETNNRGLIIRADQYPYKRGMNALKDSLPDWAKVGGNEAIIKRLQDPKSKEKIKKDMEKDFNKSKKSWDKIFVASQRTDKWRDIEGLSILEIKKIKQASSEFDIFCEILVDNNANVEQITEYGHEDDLKTLMTSRFTMIGTDGWSVPMGSGKPHPRFYGTYPRILGKYVREEKILTLEQAIRKMTSFPAQTLGLLDRGLIREGMWADLVIFDADTIVDRATYTDPHQYPDGIHYVIINGEIVVKEKQHTTVKPGKILRRNIS